MISAKTNDVAFCKCIMKLVCGVICILGIPLSATVGATANTTSSSGTPLIPKPGLVLVDPEARYQSMSLWPLTEVERLCAWNGDTPVPLPIHGLEARTGYGTDPSARPFSFAMMTRAAAWLGLRNQKAAAEAISGLDTWARSKALSDLSITEDQRNTKSIYALKAFLMGVIPSWAILSRTAAADQTRKSRIDQWLGDLVVASNVGTGGTSSRDKHLDCAGNEGHPISAPSNCNNHRYLRDAIAMAWGAYRGDETLFDQGLVRFRIALQQMRPDGSLPFETMRGARALWYQRHALASLTAIARMASLQGYNLFDLTIDGKNLALGVRYLEQAILMPKIVLPYAFANFIPGPSQDWRRQDLGFLSVRSKRHYMAWTEYLAGRFLWTSPNLISRVRLSRPLIDEYSGGNTSCLAAARPNPR